MVYSRMDVKESWVRSERLRSVLNVLFSNVHSVEKVEQLRDSIREVRRERDELREQIKQLRHENESLRARLVSLDTPGPMGSVRPELVVSDPYADWVERNRTRLADYPNWCFAIDVERDEIVEKAPDGEELNRKLIARFGRDGKHWSRWFILDTSIDF